MESMPPPKSAQNSSRPSPLARHRYLDGWETHIDALRRCPRAGVGVEDLDTAVTRLIRRPRGAGIREEQEILAAIECEIVDMLARERVVGVGRGSTDEVQMRRGARAEIGVRDEPVLAGANDLEPSGFSARVDRKLTRR